MDSGNRLIYFGSEKYGKCPFCGNSTPLSESKCIFCKKDVLPANKVLSKEPSQKYANKVLSKEPSQKYANKKSKIGRITIKGDFKDLIKSKEVINRDNVYKAILDYVIYDGYSEDESIEKAATDYSVEKSLVQRWYDDYGWGRIIQRKKIRMEVERLENMEDEIYDFYHHLVIDMNISQNIALSRTAVKFNTKRDIISNLDLEDKISIELEKIQELKDECYDVLEELMVDEHMSRNESFRIICKDLGYPVSKLELWCKEEGWDEMIKKSMEKRLSGENKPQNYSININQGSRPVNSQQEMAKGYMKRIEDLWR